MSYIPFWVFRLGIIVIIIIIRARMFMQSTFTNRTKRMEPERKLDSLFKYYSADFTSGVLYIFVYRRHSVQTSVV